MFQEYNIYGTIHFALKNKCCALKINYCVVRIWILLSSTQSSPYIIKHNHTPSFGMEGLTKIYWKLELLPKYSAVIKKAVLNPYLVSEFVFITFYAKSKKNRDLFCSLFKNKLQLECLGSIFSLICLHKICNV